MGAVCSTAFAAVATTFADDVGYSVLQSELGAALPDGNGLTVSIIEACTESVLPDGTCPGAWAPDPGSRSITEGETGPPVSSPFSGHATSVGSRFFGDTGMTPDIGFAPNPSIRSYHANDWNQGDFLRLLQNAEPLISASRVANHSWVGHYGDDNVNLNLLRRIDWLIDEDEFIQIVGFTGNSSALFGSSRNAIAVNKTGSPTNAGSRTVAGDAAYSVEQTRPDLVAPETWPSTATPRVGSATIFLIDAARANPSLSNGSTTNRNGDSILNAERSEVIKATLMAGAERVTNNSHPTSDPVDIIDYRVAAVNQRDNGLDRRYGAGQLNVYNSYHIIAAGEQDSVEENGTGNIASTGFDFDAAFGGSNGSNAQATYYFTTGSETVEFLVSLVWNVEIDPGRWSNFNQAAVLYNLDLQLFDVTGGGQVLVAESASVTENNENIRAFLKAGTPHMLRIKQGAGQGNFRWDYALAWRTRISGDVNGDGTIDVRDLSLFQQAIIGDKQLDQQQRARADVYPAGGDGALDVSDLITMQQLVLAD